MFKNNHFKIESNFFDENIDHFSEEFEGEYLAIIDEVLIAHGNNAPKVYEIAQKKYPDRMIYLAQVPTKKALIL